MSCIVLPGEKDCLKEYSTNAPSLSTISCARQAGNTEKPRIFLDLGQFAIAKCLGIFLTFVLSSFAVLLHAKPVPANNVPDRYQAYYMQGNFSACAIELEKVAQTRKLTLDEESLYGDCLYFTKSYDKSFVILRKLLDSTIKDKTRLLYRLTDIYRISDNERQGQAIGAWLRKNQHHKSEIIQIGRLAMQKKHLTLFLDMYELTRFIPVESDLNELLRSANTKELDRFLLLSPDSDARKKLLRAKSEFYRQNYATAESLARELLNSSLASEARLLLAGILLGQKKQSEVEELLSPLAEGNEQEVLTYTKFLFDYGLAERALEVTDEKIQKFGGSGAFQLRDASVFYLMSLGRLAEATARLEIYNEDKKIFPHMYYSRREDLLRHGNRSEYLNGLKQAAQLRPALCIRLIEAGMREMSDNELTQSMFGCAEMQTPHRRIMVLSQLSGAERYKALAQYFSAKPPADDSEKLLLAKALSESGQTTQALLLATALLATPRYANSDELFMISGSALMKEKKFSEASAYFARARSREARKYEAMCSIYSADFARLKKLTEMANDLPDRQYYSAIWSLSANQLKQAEVLLEHYLADAGSEGNRAVYFLFLLKYFEQNDDLFAFMNILTAYPHGLTEKSWQAVNEAIQAKAKTELQVFITFWYARYLMYAENVTTAKTILTELSQLKEAELLKEEISFLLAEKDPALRKEFLEKFPLSPWRAKL